MVVQEQMVQAIEEAESVKGDSPKRLMGAVEVATISEFTLDRHSEVSTASPSRAKRSDGEYATVPELQKRGWTETLVRIWLGTPDATRPNLRNLTRPIRLFSRSRALAVEKSDEWIDKAQKATANRATAIQIALKSRACLLVGIEALEIHVQAVSMERLSTLARRNYNKRLERLPGSRRENTQAATPKSDPAFLQDIMVDYARHRLTCYDQECEKLQRKVGNEDAYLLLNARVHAAIAASYPDLAEECRRQAARKMEAAISMRDLRKMLEQQSART